MRKYKPFPIQFHIEFSQLFYPKAATLCMNSTVWCFVFYCNIKYHFCKDKLSTLRKELKVEISFMRWFFFHVFLQYHWTMICYLQYILIKMLSLVSWISKIIKWFEKSILLIILDAVVTLTELCHLPWWANVLHVTVFSSLESVP